MACIPAEVQPVDDYITTERVALAVHLLTLHYWRQSGRWCCCDKETA